MFFLLRFSDGKQIAISSQDTRTLVHIAEPVPRFSLLPVPSTRGRRTQRAPSGGHSVADMVGNNDSSEGRPASSSRSGSASNLFEERRGSGTRSSSIKLQNLLSGSAGSNLLSAAASAATSAASGTNLLSSAAKGMSFLSSSATSYLREGETKPRRDRE